MELQGNIPQYIIKEDIKNVLAALNSKGEVVVEAEYLQKSVFIKIYVTLDKGIIVERFEGK